MRTTTLACMLLTAIAGVPAGLLHADLTPRQECLAACAARIAACTSACGAFGDLEAGCRRAVLRRCRREGTATCAASPTGESCADPRPLAVSSTLDGSLPDDTDAATDDLTPSCVVSPGGRDRVYAITNPRTTEVAFLAAAVIDADFDAVISVRSPCGSELMCANDGGVGATEFAYATMPVPPLGTVYVVVDGATADAAGSFTVNFAFE